MDMANATITWTKPTIDHPLESEVVIDLKSTPNLPKNNIERTKKKTKKRKIRKTPQNIKVSTTKAARARRTKHLTSHFGRVWNGAAVVKHLPVGKYAIGSSKYLSKATELCIIDTSTKNWLIRFDNLHKGADFSHVNLNPKLTGIPDPHIKIPDGVVTAAKGLNRTLNVVGKVALMASLVIDGYRIGSAVRGDIKRKGKVGKKTGKIVASVGSGYAGGAAGVCGGNALGGLIGGGIGTLFGGVGALPGAAVGSLVGSLVGGIGGAIGGSIAAEKIVDVVVSDSDDYEDISDDEENGDQPGFIKPSQGGAILLHPPAGDTTSNKRKPRKMKLA